MLEVTYWKYARGCSPALSCGSDDEAEVTLNIREEFPKSFTRRASCNIFQFRSRIYLRTRGTVNSQEYCPNNTERDPGQSSSTRMRSRRAHEVGQTASSVLVVRVVSLACLSPLLQGLWFCMGRPRTRSNGLAKESSVIGEPDGCSESDTLPSNMQHTRKKTTGLTLKYFRTGEGGPPT
jgi:hypothetical protein